MRLLLDTHTLIWWMTDDPHLSLPARTLIEQDGNVSVVSAVSAWEMATKVRLGRLPVTAEFVRNFALDLKREGIEILALSAEHGLHAGSLPGPHKDPFDRMLLAQARLERIPIISNDKALDGCGVTRLW